MAKNMARMENGAVINIMWCSDNQPQTDTLIDLADRPVGIGDTYLNGKFYREGVEVLTPLEEAQSLIAELDAAIINLEYQNIILEMGVTE